MARRGIAGLLVVGLLLLAGCAGGDAAAPADAGTGTGSEVQASGEALPDAGTIAGTVTDDALTPIPLAQVALLKTDIVAMTDEAGFFKITNLAPGDYDVAAAALGYNSIVKRVTVEPSAEAPASLILTKLAITAPFVEIIGPESWYFECRVGTPVLTGPCQVAVNLPNDKASMRFNATEDVQDWVGEMRWQPGSFATSKALRLSFSYTGRTSSHWFCTATSATPVQFHYDITQVGDLEDAAAVKENREKGCVTEEYCGIGAGQLNDDEPSHPFDIADDEMLQIYTNTPFGCAQPDPTHAVELSIQQRIEVMMTMFHGQHKPVDYTAFPDA